MRTPADIAHHVRQIAEYTAELLLIKENAIARFPHRSVYLMQEIERSEAIIADWLHQFVRKERTKTEYRVDDPMPRHTLD
jgi:hypothetical protein